MDDLISRRAVLKLLSTMPPEEAITKAMLIQSVKQMDVAQPERKRGKWEITNLGAVGVFDSCSECKRVVKHKAPFYNYCPNCGADMRGEQDG